MGIIDGFLDRVIANHRFAFEEVVLTPDHLAWVNDSEDNDLESYPGPGWFDPGYEPSFEEEAEERGYQAGLEGEGPCGSPTSWPTSARMAYTRGRQRAMKEREERLERERILWESWLEERAMEAELDERYAGSWWHESEAVRAVGCLEARKGGGL